MRPAVLQRHEADALLLMERRGQLDGLRDRQRRIRLEIPRRHAVDQLIFPRAPDGLIEPVIRIDIIEREVHRLVEDREDGPPRRRRLFDRRHRDRCPMGGQRQIFSDGLRKIIFCAAVVPALEGIAGPRGVGGLCGRSIGTHLLGHCAAAIGIKGHGICAKNFAVDRCVGGHRKVTAIFIV